MTVNINVDTRTIARILVVVVVVGLGLSFIKATQSVFTLLIISAFLAMALNPPVTYLSSKITGGSRGLATGIAYSAVIFGIGLFLWTVIPPLVDQSREFFNELPSYIDDFAAGDGTIAQFVRDNHLDQEAKGYVDSIANSSTLGDNSSKVFSGIGKVGASIVSVLTVLVLTFFMLIEGPSWLDKIWEAQPQGKREHRKELGKKMYNVVTGYVNGQLLVALIAAIVSLIAMLAVGVPLPLPLAGLVGFFGLIPLVGATLGATAVILVALFQSVSTAIIMLIFFVIYQQIENNAIQPIIQSRTLEVSPLLIFVAVLFGISIAGLLGAFIAIPAAAVVRILFIDYLGQKGKGTKPKTKQPRRKLTRRKASKEAEAA